MITFKAAVASCPRKSGDHNSDNFYFNSKFITEDLVSSQVMLAHKKEQTGVQMYAVTDGSSADTYKDEISLMLVRGLKKFHARLLDDPNLNAVDIIDEYNREAYAAAKRRSIANEKKPSSSLGLVFIDGKYMVFSNTGNVRIYRIRDGVAEMFSVDHTQAQKMVELGLMTSEKAIVSPQRKKLTQYFGVMPEELSFKPVVFEEEAEKDDLYVICSCGCYENVSAARMAEISDECDTAADFVKAVFAEAVSVGAREDITVLAIKAEDSAKVVPPVVNNSAVNASAHHAGSDVVGAGVASAAVSSAKSSKPVSNAERKAAAEAEKAEKKPASFSESIKAFLGIGTSKDGENSEQIWPALLVFLVCLILVIILTVYGIKIYNKNKNPEPTVYDPYGTVAPTEESTPIPTAPAVTDGTGVLNPTDGPQATAPITTGGTQTTAPTAEAPATEAPATEAPATEPPATETPADPTVEPTDEPAEPTDEPAEPTDEPAEPTDEPTEPTDEPAEPTDEPTEPTDEPTEPTDEPSVEA